MVKILDAKYKKADLPAIIKENCSHLTASDREKLLSVLLKFKSLFDSTLSDWKLPPVSFELKEGMNLYHGRPYSSHHVCTFFGNGKEMLNYIRASGDLSQIHGYSIHSL
jgi:hypothetical protein